MPFHCVRFDPEGHWKLAGGDSHRKCRTKTDQPRRGDGALGFHAANPGPVRNSRLFILFRWLSPPANFSKPFESKG